MKTLRILKKKVARAAFVAGEAFVEVCSTLLIIALFGGAVVLGLLAEPSAQPNRVLKTLTNLRRLIAGTGKIVLGICFLPVFLIVFALFLALCPPAEPTPAEAEKMWNPIRL